MGSGISVVTVNYNSGAFLPRLLSSLDAQTVQPMEVIVVDNASTDGSVAMIRDRWPHVRVIELGWNAGFSIANNQGVAAAAGDFIALINSDAWADPSWLAELSSAISVDERRAAVVGKIYYASGDGVFDQAGAFFNNVGNYWGRGHREKDVGQYDEECEVAGLTACAMLIRRAALQDQPLFDSDFFMYGEELDLTLRLRGAGYSIVYTPKAIAYHEGMGSLTATRTDARLFQQLHANRNRLQVVARRYPASLIFRSLPAMTLAFFYWNGFFLFRGGPLVLIRALISQLRSIRRGQSLRRKSEIDASPRWLPWLTHQSIRDMLAVRWVMQAHDRRDR